jgi:multimeric flavodoxin WrbA
MDIDLNPDGPHNPERTAEAGQLLDDCSRFLTYATMSDKGGLDYPADACRLVADFYSATGRIPQMCEQLDRFLRGHLATGRIYDAKTGDPQEACEQAARDLHATAMHAANLARALQAVQADIAGLGVKEEGHR